MRDDEETAWAPFPAALHVPMNEISASLDALPRDRDLIVVCHFGVRSAHVVAYLRRMGFRRAVNLRGGLDAWAREIDPSVPRY